MLLKFIKQWSNQVWFSEKKKGERGVGWEATLNQGEPPFIPWHLSCMLLMFFLASAWIKLFSLSIPIYSNFNLFITTYWLCDQVPQAPTTKSAPLYYTVLWVYINIHKIHKWRCDSNVTVAWQSCDSNITVTWQWCDRKVTVTWQTCDSKVTVTWQSWDSDMTDMWKQGDSYMTVMGQWHDRHVTARWQWHTIITDKFSPLQNSTTDFHENHLHCHHLWANHHQLHYLPTTPIILYTFTAITALQPNKAKMCSLIILFLFSASSKKLIAEQ